MVWWIHPHKTTSFENKPFVSKKTIKYDGETKFLVFTDNPKLYWYYSISRSLEAFITLSFFINTGVFYELDS